MIYKDIELFLRPVIGISASFISMAGSLLNDVSIEHMILSAMIAFFSCSAVYSYNNMTDTEEDKKNNRKMSSYSLNRKVGNLAIIILATSAMITSLLLGTYAIIFSLFSITAGICYSTFRIKKYMIVKNLYTCTPLALLFLLGAGAVSGEMVFYFMIIFLFLLAGTIISDIRDFEGDKEAGAKTIPVVMGIITTKNIMIILISIILAAAAFDIRNLFVFSIFVFGTLILLIKNKFKEAHKFNMVSFIFLDIWLILLRLPS